jgi:hypothetical protein
MDLDDVVAGLVCVESILENLSVVSQLWLFPVVQKNQTLRTDLGT